jgi:hypothetical protein
VIPSGIDEAKLRAEPGEDAREDCLPYDDDEKIDH